MPKVKAKTKRRSMRRDDSIMGMFECAAQMSQFFGPTKTVEELVQEALRPLRPASKSFNEEDAVIARQMGIRLV